MVRLLSHHTINITHITRALEFVNVDILPSIFNLASFDRATCKVEGLNIRLKHNQALIIKYLMTYRDSIVDKYLHREALAPKEKAEVGV